jgi:hypothetical protein
VAGKDPTTAATLPVYGDVSGWYSYFFTELKALGHVHIVVLAHEYYNINEDSSVHSIQPLLTGSKVLNKIPAMFKEVWYMERRADQAILHYKPWKKAIANSLILHAGNGEIADPTFDKVMAEVEKQKGAVKK